MRVNVEVEVVDMMAELSDDDLVKELKLRKSKIADKAIVDYLISAGIETHLTDQVAGQLSRPIPTRASLLTWEGLCVPAAATN